MSVFIEDYFHRVEISDGYFENRTVTVGFQGPQGIPGPAMPHIASLKVSGQSYTNPGADVYDGSMVDRTGLTEGEEDYNLDYFGRKIMEVFGVPRGGYRNIGVPGNTARDGYWYTLQFENPQRDWPYAADTSVACVVFGGNDITQGTSTVMLNSFREGMKSIIARYIASKVFDHNNTDADGQFVLDFDYNWKEILFAEHDELFPQYHGSGDGYWSTNITGAYLTFDTPSDFDTGYIHIGFVASTQGGSGDIYIDDVLADTVTTSSLNASGGATTSFTHKIVRLAVDDGQHTIKVVCTGVTATGYLSVNYWQIEAREKPIVLVSDLTQPSNPQSIWGVMQDPAETSLMNDEITAAVAYFDHSNIVVVPANEATDGDYDTWYTNKNEQYFIGDGLHLNAFGANRVVNAFYKKASDVVALSNNADGYKFLNNWQYQKDPVFHHTNKASRLYSGSGLPFTIDNFQRDGNRDSLGGDWENINGKFGLTGQKDTGDAMEDDFYQRGGQAKLFSYMTNVPDWTDTFDRNDSATTLGSPWTANVGTWGVKNRKAYCAVDSGTNIATIDTGYTDMYARTSIQNGTLNDGMVFKYIDANNHMKLIQTGVGLRVYKVVAGVTTDLGSPTGASGWDIAIEVSGSNAYVYDAGSKSSVTFTVDAALLAGTKAGLITNGTTPYFDVFEYGPYEGTTFSQTYAVAAIETGFSDGVVSMGFGSDLDDGQALLFRIQDYQNYYGYVMTPTLGTGSFFKMVAGTLTLLGTVDLFGGGRNTNFRIEFSGNTFNAYTDGSDDPFESITDNTFATGTMHGIMAPFSAWNAFDGYFESFGWGQTYFKPRDNDMYIDTSSGRIYGPYDYENSTWGVSDALIGSGAFISKNGDHMVDSGNDAYLTIGVDSPSSYWRNGNRLMINNPYQSYTDAAAIIAANESYKNLILSGPYAKNKYFMEVQDQHKNSLFSIVGDGRLRVKNIEEFLITNASSGTSCTIDVEDGSVHDITLTDNVTFIFTGANNGISSSFTLIARQDGGGANTITWPGSVLWPGAIEPTKSTGANDIDIYTFFTNDGGTIWYGFQAGKDMS
jgi:lysophospholipase L1-like esterase